MITAALVAWPFVILVCALRATWPMTVVVAIFGGYMLLPVGHGLDLPLLPPFDKYSIPIFTLIFLALVLRPGVTGGPLAHAMAPEQVCPGWLPRNKVALICLSLWVGGVFATVFTNRDALVYGPTVLPGLGLYDAFSMLVTSSASLLTVLLARKYLWHPEMHRFLLAAFGVAALIYAFPALYEVRMSPQLSNMIYGFFPHSFAQHIRGGGFRPVVFMEHGLWLGMFLALGALSLFAVSKLSQNSGIRFAATLAGVFLVGVVFLSKTLGAFLIMMVMIPIILLMPIRLQVVAGGAIALLVLLYPMTRNADLIPTDRLVNAASSISPDRAQSFAFRVEHEEALLAHAGERPLFGWGGWSRNRVFDEAGRDTSVTDGYWVITFGIGGWARYLAAFGLLLLPLVLLTFQKNREQFTRPSIYLGLILAANAVDLLPNAGQTPITWLLAGALWGYLEKRRPEYAQAAALRSSECRPLEQSKLGYRSGQLYTRQVNQHVRKPRPTSFSPPQ